MSRLDGSNRADASAPRDARRLIVAWQNPSTRLISPVGSITRSTDGRFCYRYLRGALEVDDFLPFVAFPELDHRYESADLFPFFHNRMMSARRADYATFVSALGLDPDADPFEVLARSSGSRETDTIEVFPEPMRDPATGRGVSLFLARGLRHIEGIEETLASLSVSDELVLHQDEENPVNPQALLLLEHNGRRVGWVPNFLLDHVYETSARCDDGVRITVEHINGPGTVWHLRLLCRLETCWPDGYRPFDEPAFEFISEGSLASTGAR